MVLGREEDGSIEIGPREGFGGPQPTLFVGRRDEPEPGTSRRHIDVNATDRDQDAELQRLLELGARPADIGQTGAETWYVLADPEGPGEREVTERRAGRRVHCVRTGPSARPVPG
ncbi:VOC family protein [Streptomyces sp. NPDC038707]|uniref:VOC family protein n=1 Tax=Streptomyces sp. NPDC038707 TaxID=3154329 RepID=UPI00340E9B69